MGRTTATDDFLVVFYGLRFEHTCPWDDPVAGARWERRLADAEQAGLSTWSSQGGDGAAYVMVGERLGLFGAGHEQGREILRVGVHDMIQRTRERLSAAQLQGTPALHIQCESASQRGMEDSVVVVFYGLRLEAPVDHRTFGELEDDLAANPDLATWLGRTKDAAQRHLFVGALLQRYGGPDYWEDEAEATVFEGDLVVIMRQVERALAEAGLAGQPALHIEVEDADARE